MGDMADMDAQNWANRHGQGIGMVKDRVVDHLSGDTSPTHKEREAYKANRVPYSRRYRDPLEGFKTYET